MQKIIPSSAMKKILLFVCACLFAFMSFAQQLSQQDLSRINVDALSDKEILYYYNKLQQSGISFDQAAQMAAARGMPAEQIEKLRQRIQDITSGVSTQPNTSKTNPSQPQSNMMYDSTMQYQARGENGTLVPFADELYDSRVFGSEIFRSSSLSFEPNLRIATPANYVLGPDDELLIDVYGYSEQNYKLRINPEGNVYIPNAGPVFVSGLTVDDAAAKIRAKLAATIYKAIGTGATRVQVSLGSIRSIRVTIIGQAKKPGTYTLSSLATVFNALYMCGGPAFNGSYRNIELVRNNKTIRVIDLYNFLLKGSLGDNVRLMDQDVIRIPYYQNRATFEGEIKRPGIFELQPGDNLQKVLEAAGGFSDSAYRSSVKITRVSGKDRQVLTVEQNQFNGFALDGGDLITVGKITDRYANRVTISGAVMRPGEYELKNEFTVKQLISAADGLREDAYMKRGIISRQKSDLTKETVAFDVAAVMKGDDNDVMLRREDSVFISSVGDLREDFTVTIQGAVKKQGIYKYKDSTTIKDLILQAGGFSVSATARRIEIARRVTDGDSSKNFSQIAKIIQVDADRELSVDDGGYFLQPYDVVIVRTNPGYFTQKTVTVVGEVMYPGQYVLNSVDEKLSSIIERTGGFKGTADPAGASLRRFNRVDDQALIKTAKVAKLASGESTGDTAAVDSLAKEAVKPFDLIGINLEEVMATPGITNDLILEDGDLIYIPKKNAAVKVRGEVLFPTQFAYQQDKTMKYYINKAGGYASTAMRRKSFVLGANGSARQVKRFLFIKSYPKIYAGDEIYVPTHPQDYNSKLTTAEKVGIISATVSMASVVVALINSLK